jgi:branched-chain amino acid transport system substrate-binding protein
MLKPVRSVALLTLGALALAACGGGDETGDTSSSGGGGKTLVISSDLPLQGASADASAAMNNAIEVYLDQIGHKAGKYNIEFKKYDDSDTKGKWSDAVCQKNAQDHVANADEVAVMGTYNSGCAKLEVPVLNAAGMLMVSHANTNVGLTRPEAPGEPQKFFPSGTRSYARVITTDDYQGLAAATFASEKLGVKSVYILNDNETYGQGVAQAFSDTAKKLGITVIANEAWDSKQPNYSALFNKIKATNPDMVYLGGIYDNNGGQLVKDKVSVLGSNEDVYLMAPDGFVGYPPFQKLKESEGTYMTFAGLSTDQIEKRGGAAKTLLDDYAAKYGGPPATSYALYAVAAVQVILAAIEKSDGTREDITKQVFTAPGITIPEDKSVLGKEIVIDTATGDTLARDITVLQMKGGKEAFVQAQDVG